MRALVFGSLNIDFVYRVDHFVQRGETLASSSLQRFSGGKGLNQAIALSRAGLATSMAGAVGEDGLFLLEELRNAGADPRFVDRSPVRTGHAIIQSTPDGDNCILLYGGANRTVSGAQAAAVLEHFGEGDLLLVQNEISALSEIMAQARDRGMIAALNPSPMDAAAIRRLLPLTDLLILNRVEASQLLAQEGKNPEDTARTLQRQCGCRQIVLTLGSEGSVLCREGETIHQKAFRVRAVDTTGAGDTFTGFFLAGLFLEHELSFALRYAAAAAALAVTRPGAAPSIPTREETLAFLESNT